MKNSRIVNYLLLLKDGGFFEKSSQTSCRFMTSQCFQTRDRIHIVETAREILRSLF